MRLTTVRAREVLPREGPLPGKAAVVGQRPRSALAVTTGGWLLTVVRPGVVVSTGVHGRPGKRRDRETAHSPWLARLVRRPAAIAWRSPSCRRLSTTPPAPARPGRCPRPLTSTRRALPRVRPARRPLTLREPTRTGRARLLTGVSCPFSTWTPAHSHSVPARSYAARAGGVLRVADSTVVLAERPASAGPGLNSRGVRRSGQRRHALAWHRRRRSCPPSPTRLLTQGRRRGPFASSASTGQNGSRPAHVPEPALGRAGVDLHVAPRHPGRGTAGPASWSLTGHRRGDARPSRAGPRSRRRRGTGALAGVRPCQLQTYDRFTAATTALEPLPDGWQLTGRASLSPTDGTGQPCGHERSARRRSRGDRHLPARSTPTAQHHLDLHRSAASAGRGCSWVESAGYSCRRLLAVDGQPGTASGVRSGRTCHDSIAAW